MIARSRLPSQSEDDELGVIAAALDLIDGAPGRAREIIDRVTPRMFTSPAGAVLMAMQAAFKASTTPTWQDVRIALRDAGYANESDEGQLLIDALWSTAWTGRNAEQLADGAIGRIIERHRHRATVDAAQDVVNAGGDPESVARLLEVAAAPVDRPKAITAIDALDQWSRHERTPKVPTGFGWLDDPTDGGLPIGGTTALVAGPGIGKSAAALQWVCGALIQDLELRAVWGLGEMTPAGLARRMLCVASGLLEGCPAVTMDMAGRRTRDARAASVRIAEAIGGRLHIVPAPLTVAAIDAMVCTTGAKLVVIDYAQLVHIPGGGKDRVADLDRLAGEIRDMAIARECAVILPSSMAKAAGAAVNAAQAARGSAEIGFAAELVYVGVREETPDGRPIVGPDGCHGITWRCAKARNCEPRDLVTRFDGSTQTFHDGRQDPDGFRPGPCQDLAAWAAGVN